MIEQMRRGNLVVGLFVIATAACQPKSPQPATSVDAAGARKFVADFYAWYHPDSGEAKGIDSVLAIRRTALSDELARLFEKDAACVAESAQVCTIDSDPFLDSQDPCDRYEVGGTIPHGEVIGVSVFAVCDGVRDSTPRIVAMVWHGPTGWQFTNFVSGNNGQFDIRSELKRAYPE